MPQLEVTTKEANQIWASPDGQRVIFELTMDYQGKPVKAKTYSKEIATEGWSGTIETYEKEGKGGRPAETFVKQPQKEGGYSGGGYRGGGAQRQPKDEAAIKAQMAIKAAVQALPEAKPANLTDYLADVEAVAQGLYEMIDRVKATQPELAKPEEETEEMKDEVHEVTEEAIDLGAIDEMFPDNEKL